MKEIAVATASAKKEVTRSSRQKRSAKKMADLVKQHGENVKFSKMVVASTHPCGAPHV